jgi:hypothetical protein
MPDKATIAITICYKELGYNNLMITKIVLYDSVDISEPDSLTMRELIMTTKKLIVTKVQYQ